MEKIVYAVAAGRLLSFGRAQPGKPRRSYASGTIVTAEDVGGMDEMKIHIANGFVERIEVEDPYAEVPEVKTLKLDEEQPEHEAQAQPEAQAESDAQEEPSDEEQSSGDQEGYGGATHRTVSTR